MDTNLVMMDALKRVKDENIKSRLYKIIQKEVYIGQSRFAFYDVPLFMLTTTTMVEINRALRGVGIGLKSHKSLFKALEELGVDKKNLKMKHKHYPLEVKMEGEVAYGECAECGEHIVSIGWKTARDSMLKKEKVNQYPYLDGEI